MIRVAMLSFWHVHAKDYAKQATDHPDTEIVAVWDEISTRGQTAAQTWGGRFYEDLDTLLAQSDIDAVIIDTPTDRHRDVMVAAAQAGKHIFTEKVVAPTLREANEILAAVERAGVKLTVSLPRLNAGYTQAIQAILASGRLGTPTLVRARLSHNGGLPTADNANGWLPAHFYDLQQCAGGALIDLGCHPMYLVRLFLGLPESISARYGYVIGRAVEDNAVALLSYPNGALGVVEAGFVNRHSPFTIEVHGTDGSLLYGTPEARLVVRSGQDAQWRTAEVPDELPSAFHQWVTHIQNGTTATENIQMALDLTKLMETANRSVAENRPVRLDELAE
ncbi:MAG TPA: Gfo/Idh/MocA family oxidoreductase [Roseiflexaceae bacterium]|nr:Gfo/Idh/MocA family oxidoreductase [Roseiflexaceae bacterium]